MCVFSKVHQNESMDPMQVHQERLTFPQVVVLDPVGEQEVAKVL